MQPDAAFRPRQPCLNQLRVMITCIVHKGVQQPLSRQHRLDCHEQHDGAGGIDRQNILDDGLAGLEVDRALDIQAVPATALFDSDNLLPRRPATDRAHAVAGVRGVSKNHGFIIEHLPQQVVIALDEGGLFGPIQLALHRRGWRCSMPRRCSSAISPERVW